MGIQRRAPSGHLDVTRHRQTWHGLSLVMDTGTPGPWDDPAERAPLGRGSSSISLSSQPTSPSEGSAPSASPKSIACRSTARHQQTGFRHSRGD